MGLVPARVCADPRSAAVHLWLRWFRWVDAGGDLSDRPQRRNLARAESRQRLSDDLANRTRHVVGPCCTEIHRTLALDSVRASDKTPMGEQDQEFWGAKV